MKNQNNLSNWELRIFMAGAVVLTFLGAFLGAVFTTAPLEARALGKPTLDGQGLSAGTGASTVSVPTAHVAQCWELVGLQEKLINLQERQIKLLKD